jgi:dihydroorotase
MTRRVAYINARLLDPATGLDEHGALLTDGARIADFGRRLFADGVPDGVETIDLGGQCLAPGLVDMRAQLGEPGEEHKETILTASRSAAAGGVTATVCLPNTDPVIDDVSGIEFIARRAREVRLVKVFAYAAATKKLQGRELTEMGLLSEAGAVAFTDGVKAIADAVTMRRALSYASTFGLLIVQHPEELRLVELTGARYHAAHISTREAVDVIRQAKRRGLPVTCDTAPPYFALTETDVGDYRTFAKLSPPLRGEMDRRAIVEGLADGTIDAIGSDHTPHDQDSKRVPFSQAAPGVVGLETLLPLTLELVHNGKLPLLKALAAVTCRPADILGLPLGRLAKGGPADLVVFDPDRLWRIDADRLLSKSKNCPFDHRPVTGRATRTVVDGRTVYELRE